MFENLLVFSNDRLRPLLTNGLRWAQVMRNWYQEAGCSETEACALKFLKDWLSAGQLAQFKTQDISTSLAATAERGTAYAMTRRRTSMKLITQAALNKSCVLCLNVLWPRATLCSLKRSR